MLSRRTGARAVLGLLVAVALGGLVAGYVTFGGSGGGQAFAVGERVAPPAGGPTVVTTSMQGDDFLVAIAANGTVLAYADRHDVYDDVDPSPAGRWTVTYVATDQRSRNACDSTRPCSRNVVERLNLTTGEREVLFSRVTPRYRNHWHDVDRDGPGRWLVADIALDRVFVFEPDTGLTRWEWAAQSDFDLAGGGLYPGDWTHLNDVERLPDGRVMVSLRNQDQVVFVDPEAGHQPGWTLGADGDHDVLHEQHNPDYLPRERGGPAVVVADSENNRIVEYHRANGSWERAWQWSDVELQWPRDADRLPNGNTLVTDTNGGRVLEVAPNGTVVWEFAIKGAYEAERLGTGDESAGGPAANDSFRSRTAATGPARPDAGPSVGDRLLARWKALLPGPLVNPVLYVMPPWFGFPELAAALLLVVAGGTWGGLEAYWRGYRPRWPVARADGGEAAPGRDGDDANDGDDRDGADGRDPTDPE